MRRLPAHFALLLTVKVPPLMVASFQFNTAGPSVFVNTPPSMVSTPKSSFLTVFMPPLNSLPDLMVRLTLAPACRVRHAAVIARVAVIAVINGTGTCIVLDKVRAVHRQGTQVLDDIPFIAAKGTAVQRCRCAGCIVERSLTAIFGDDFAFALHGQIAVVLNGMAAAAGDGVAVQSMVTVTSPGTSRLAVTSFCNVTVPPLAMASFSDASVSTPDCTAFWFSSLLLCVPRVPSLVPLRSQR